MVVVQIRDGKGAREAEQEVQGHGKPRGLGRVVSTSLRCVCYDGVEPAPECARRRCRRLVAWLGRDRIRCGRGYLARLGSRGKLRQRFGGAGRIGLLIGHDEAAFGGDDGMVGRTGAAARTARATTATGITGSDSPRETLPTLASLVSFLRTLVRTRTCRK